jgi:hypothetical protein
MGVRVVVLDGGVYAQEVGGRMNNKCLFKKKHDERQQPQT